MTGTRAVAATLGAAALLAGACSSSPSSSSPSQPSAPAQVLTVGTWHGHKGRFATIQAAVDAAKPGAWILVAPGDYHENDDLVHPPTPHQMDLGAYGGVLITTPGIHLVGMSRSGVIVDGTAPGAPTPCDSAPQYQELGSKASNGKTIGRNGIVVFDANDVTIDNLTACNFLAGSGPSGNEIWWNGGSGTAKIGMTGYWGDYLTATSSYAGPESVDATYGIFSSDAAGPAEWNHVYASDMNDSGAYIGACRQVCNVTVDNSWFEYSALGYSGTNSGGAIVIENSEFDHNQDGFDTNTQLIGDPPPPQDGDCPNGGVSPITHTHSCWVFMDNYVHDNNNADVPSAGSAAQGPVGTGMTVSGGRNDTVMHNRFVHNGAWGILFLPYPNSGTPPHGVTCKGIGGTENSVLGCILDPEGNALLDNTFQDNGFFHNPSNGDFGEITFTPHEPVNCFAGNHAPDGSSPADLEHSQPKCTGALSATVVSPLGSALLSQVLCDTGVAGLPCPAGATYPKVGQSTVMRPLPSLASMPNPCAGAPKNAWC